MGEISRRQLQFGGLAAMLASGFAADRAVAQGYPNRLVKVIIPFAAGGSTDAVTRPLLEALHRQLGQPFVIENRGGAGSVVGTAQVATSPPDGYTLLSTTASFVTTMVAQQQTYSLESFDTVAMLTQSPFTILVTAQSPIRTIDDLVKLAREKNGNLAYATAGAGSSTHFATEYFCMRTGIRMQHVPYRGIGPALIGLLRDDVNVMITTPASASGQIQDGSIRVVAYTAPGIPEGFPVAPIVKDTGLDYQVTSWWAMLGPRGIPAEVRTLLNGAINNLLKTPEMAKIYRTIGSAPAPMGLDEFMKMLTTETAQFAEVAKFADIKIE
ncbi:tripartite tricarboxylate transporter substrate binding protein [Bradyrhizobium sp. LHD-71]|uniref:Bug family tripartite tricarboxylate transporter substrate binding protein n=1 Tax=Bradyrhizobium sp. LHD-71 TaxID=3072141 RepID=UPI00280F0CDA|nr:tripartite tricarboxylate transporter substrate binding protein [Bradyrhizobium sp. LHD-71]MDQ8728203.1 tripartite tricarboxylate transporter substrate binding protein [Bradyrhizobium sp. LHD-71]